MTNDVLSTLGHLALGSRLKRAGTILQGATQTWLRDHGCDVPAGHMPLIVMLCNEGRVSIGALVEQLGIAQPGVSRMVANLEAAGLVSSVADAGDKRVRLLELTPSGRTLVDAAKEYWWPVVNDAVAALCADLAGPFSDQLAIFEAKLAAGDYERMLDSERARRGPDGDDS
ncbi:MAG: MarR family winged helix-turn-helix transcriptional regulator [Rhodospirillales bacterium]